MSDEQADPSQTDNTGNDQETEVEPPPATSEEEHPSSPGQTGSGEENPSTSNPSTSNPPTSNHSKSDPSTSGASKAPEEAKSFTNLCTDFVVTVYQDRYYRQILKSVLVFLVALKMAQESRMMLIPIKEYEPFRK